MAEKALVKEDFICQTYKEALKCLQEDPNKILKIQIILVFWATKRS